MQDDHIEPPTTIKEVGIHIGYMREDMNELKEMVKQLPNGFASKVDLTALEVRVTKLEKRNDLKNTLQWVALVVTTIISILAAYNIWGGK